LKNYIGKIIFYVMVHKNFIHAKWKCEIPSIPYQCKIKVKVCASCDCCHILKEKVVAVGSAAADATFLSCSCYSSHLLIMLLTSNSSMWKYLAICLIGVLGIVIGNLV
jgi:hypothetical protein